MPFTLKNDWNTRASSHHSEDPKSDDPETIHHPGALALRSGLYWVSHLRHRLTHLAFVEEGEVLPLCRRCGNGVSYTLQQRARHLASDRDFPLRPKVLLPKILAPKVSSGKLLVIDSRKDK